MSATKKSISLPQELFDAAIERQNQKRLATFSDYVQSLIRADMEATAKDPQMQGQVDVLRDEMRSLAYKLDAVASGKPVSYKKTRRKPSVGQTVPRHKLNES